MSDLRKYLTNFRLVWQSFWAFQTECLIDFFHEVYYYRSDRFSVGLTQILICQTECLTDFFPRSLLLTVWLIFCRSVGHGDFNFSDRMSERIHWHSPCLLYCYGNPAITVFSIMYLGYSMCSASGCYLSDSKLYNGGISTTESGRQCQHWHSQRPHRHRKYTDADFPADTPDTLGHNFCRDPDNKGAISYVFIFSVS